MKLDFEQRQKATELEACVIDDPTWAASEIVGLRDLLGKTLGHIRYAYGEGVAHYVPDWVLREIDAALAPTQRDTP